MLPAATSGAHDYLQTISVTADVCGRGCCADGAASASSTTVSSATTASSNKQVINARHT